MHGGDTDRSWVQCQMVMIEDLEGSDCSVLEFNQNGGRMTSFMAQGCL
jgi:hypothetical protein